MRYKALLWLKHTTLRPTWHSMNVRRMLWEVWGIIGVGIGWVVEGEVEMSCGLEVKSEEGEELETEGKEKERRYRREGSQDGTSKVGEEEDGEWQTYCKVD